MILPRKERKEELGIRKHRIVERKTCLTCFLIIISYIIILFQNVSEPNSHIHTQFINGKWMNVEFYSKPNIHRFTYV